MLSQLPLTQFGEAQVPCGLCKVPTPNTGTCRCDRCWELEKRVEANPAITLKILANIDRKKFIQAVDKATEIVKAMPAWEQEVLSEALINSPWRKGSPQRCTDFDELKQRCLFYAKCLNTIHGGKTDNLDNYHAVDWNNEYDDGFHFRHHTGCRDECIGYCIGSNFLHGKVVVASSGQTEAMVCWPEENFGEMVILKNPT